MGIPTAQLLESDRKPPQGTKLRVVYSRLATGSHGVALYDDGSGPQIKLFTPGRSAKKPSKALLAFVQGLADAHFAQLRVPTPGVAFYFIWGDYSGISFWF